MERLFRMTLISACLAGGFGIAFTAAAEQTVAADVQAGVQVDATRVNAQADAQAPTGPTARNVNCLQDTGTRIRARDPKTGKPLCQGPGRAYSRDDLNRTGQTDIADALRRLDPSVR